VKRLAGLGYVEGKNVIFEERYGAGEVDRLPAFARELAALKLDLIISVGSEVGARALIEAKPNVPLVLSAINYDPVETGFVASYARPGSSVTGAYIPQPALAVKRFELARELMPSAKRFLVFSDALSKAQSIVVARAAEQGGLQLEMIQFAADPYNYEAAFKQGHRARMQALIVPLSNIFLRNRVRLADLALRHQLPAIGAETRFAEAGFLAAYSGSAAKLAARTAEIAGDILKGASPAVTAIEQVHDYELALNLKTAKALALNIPPAVMVRAMKVFG